MTFRGTYDKIFNCVVPQVATTAPTRLKRTIVPRKASLRNQRRLFMNKSAVIETGGKQYNVEEGSVIYVEKLDVEAGKEVVFDKVLFANGTVGMPYVEGATVTGTVEKQGKQKKIIVFHYNPKKKFRKKQGHRQPYTKVEIKSIKTK